MATETADVLEARIAATWTRARAHLAEGRADEAAAAFGMGAEYQRRVNERFPDSRAASLDRLAQFEAGRQTALAGPALRDLRHSDRQLDEHLRRREMRRARLRLAAMAEAIADLRTKLPRARAEVEALAVKVAFLQSRADTLVELQDRIYETLHPLPGRRGKAMSRRPVTAAEFRATMGFSPGANDPDESAVALVSQAEAADYCRRLGWLLGFGVRLPEPGEFADAFPATASGFAAELPGEWLHTGAAADPTQGRGFRVVAEVDLTVTER